MHIYEHWDIMNWECPEMIFGNMKRGVAAVTQQRFSLLGPNEKNKCVSMKKNLPLWGYVYYFKLLSLISLSVYLYFGSICVAFHLPNAVCYFAEIRASVALTVAANSHRISTTTDRLSNVNTPYNYKRSILETK